MLQPSSVIETSNLANPNTHQVLPLDALLLALPVEGTVVKADRVCSWRGDEPCCRANRPGFGGGAGQLVEQPLVLSVNAAHFLIGEGVVLPVSASGAVDDQVGVQATRYTLKHLQQHGEIYGWDHNRLTTDVSLRSRIRLLGF